MLYGTPLNRTLKAFFTKFDIAANLCCSHYKLIIPRFKRFCYFKNRLLVGLAIFIITTRKHMDACKSVHRNRLTADSHKAVRCDIRGRTKFFNLRAKKLATLCEVGTSNIPFLNSLNSYS